MTEGPSVAEHMQYYIDSAFNGGWAGYYPWSYYGIIGLNPMMRYDGAPPKGNVNKRQTNAQIYREFNRAHAKDLDLGP